MSAVLVHPVVIVHPVRQIGTFLDLRDQSARSDGVHRPCLDIKDVVLFYGNFLKIFFHRPLLQTLPKRFLIYVMIKTVYEPGVLRSVHHIPHLCLPQRTVLMLTGIIIVRVHLHRQILPGVDKLDQDRQFSVRMRMGAQIFRMLLQHLCQKLSRMFPAGRQAGTVRMRGAFPCLRQRFQIDPFREIIIEPAAAPQIVLPGRFQQKRTIILPVRIFVCHGR